MQDRSPSHEHQLDSLKQSALIAYILQAVSYIILITIIPALIIAYIQRKEARGTWLESHFAWQITTFWYTLLFSIIGVIGFFFVIGIPILLLVLVWNIYRIVKGWLYLNDSKPLY